MGAKKSKRIYGLRKLLIMDLNGNLTEEEKYTRAMLKVKEIKEFYGHAIAFCVVIPLLIYLNVLNSPGFYWFWFPIGGWGFGLLMHAIRVFKKTSRWEERKIQEYMNDENF